MPRNNSRERRTARRAAAQAAAENRIDTPQVASVEDQTDEVLREASLLYNAVEWERRITHQCGKSATCSLHPKVCSAVNQNMPPHLLTGQITE